jgi:transposase
MLHYHAGWNFALNRQVGDSLFHHTTLVNFRQRLLDHDLSAIGFETVLEALIQAGLVSRQSRQRLDSTQMFGRISRMSRLDCVRESLRLALEELAPKLKEQERPAWWAQTWDRYVDSQADYRAPLETLARKMVEAGSDAQQLLTWQKTLEVKELAQGTQAKLLARVFGEQFELIDGTAAAQPKTKDQLGSERVQNPHDPDATYASKGTGDQKKEHVGYKVQVAETVNEAVLSAGEPTGNFISGIVTHAARESDEEGSLKMEKEQKDMGLMDKPPVQYVDAAYISTAELMRAAAESRELIGPAPQAASKSDQHFCSDNFNVTVQERKAVCPAGKENSQCSRLEEKTSGKVAYRFEWSSADCANCPLRKQCMKTDHKHRTLVVGEHHAILQERRREQKSQPFKERMKHRNAIEGTQSELVRAHGLRRARYRGLSKTKLQNYFAAAACNVKRWIRLTAWDLHAAITGNLGSAAAN